jgi:hypothetical protein
MPRHNWDLCVSCPCPWDLNACRLTARLTKSIAGPALRTRAPVCGLRTCCAGNDRMSRAGFYRDARLLKMQQIGGDGQGSKPSKGLPLVLFRGCGRLGGHCEGCISVCSHAPPPLSLWCCVLSDACPPFPSVLRIYHTNIYRTVE